MRTAEAIHQEVREHKAPVAPGQCALVLALAMLSLAVQLNFIPIVGMGPGFEAISLSRSLVLDGAFADPFDGPSGPSAHMAPLYPLLLAAIERHSPDEQYSRMVVLGLTLALHAVLVLLVFLVAADLFPDARTRIVTLGLLLAVPLYQVIPAWETIWLCCGVPAFWLLARRKRVLLAGLLGGALLLFNPAVILILLPVAAWEWKRVRPAAAFLLIACLAILPWEVRNYRTFGKVFFVRDNLGLELDVSNNDCEAFGATGCAPHPVASEAERRIIAEIGEANYNQVRFRRAMAWLAAHPAGALSLAVKRLGWFWLPLSGAPPYGWCISLVTAASVWGLWRLWRDRHPAVWPMLAVSAIYPAIYYFIRIDYRYRYPILSLSVLAAAYGIARIRR